MTAKKQLSRRTFISGVSAATVVGIAAPLFIPARALGRDGATPPSERLQIGFIGCGAMGRANMNGFVAQPDVAVVHLCDTDLERANQAVDLIRNHPTGDENASPAVTQDFREVIANPSVDIIVNATPDHWHAAIGIAAARAGKDIYGEKPLALTIEEGRRMVDAVTRYGSVFQVGSQQRSGRDFRFACELVRNGRIGNVRRVIVGIPGGPGPSPGVQDVPAPAHFDYETWLGPAPWAPYDPNRCHWNFRWIYDYSGGQVTDWGAHHVDIAQWGLGREESGPVEVRGRAVFPAEGIWNTPMDYEFDLVYDDGIVINASNKHPQGIRFIGDRGEVFVNRQKIEATPETLLREEFGPDDIQLPRSPGHQRNFLDCVRTRARTVAPIEVGHRSITTCHLANISMRLGTPVPWDPVTETTTDPEAARMLSRPSRAPWGTIA